MSAALHRRSLHRGGLRSAPNVYGKPFHRHDVDAFIRPEEHHYNKRLLQLTEAAWSDLQEEEGWT